jgi:hypothetical protein
MRRFWVKPLVAAALAGAALVPVALADGGSPQGAGGPPARDGWSVTVGGGGFSPDDGIDAPDNGMKPERRKRGRKRGR